MVRRYCSLFIAIVLVSFGYSQSPDLKSNRDGLEVLRRSFAAHGGIRSTDSLRIAFKVSNPKNVDEGQSWSAYAPFDSYPADRSYKLDNIGAMHEVKTKVTISGDFTFQTIDLYENGRGFSCDPIMKRFWEITGNPTQSVVYLPQNQLSAALRNPLAVRSMGVKIIEGITYDHIVALRDNNLYNIYIDKSTHLLYRVESLRSMGVYGDGFYQITFNNYKWFGDVVMPQEIVIITDNAVNGRVENVFSVHEVTTDVSFSAGDFKVPEGYEKHDYSYRKPFELKKLAKDIYLIESVTRTTGQWSTNVLFCVFDEFVLVVEAPVNDNISQQVITKIKEVAPGKSIRFLVQSHHHNDHLGGIRRYIAEGSTIVTTTANESLIRKIASAPFVINPDRLAIHPRDITIETLSGGKKVIEDKNHKVVIYDIGPNPHAKEMLITYFPNEKILYQADMICDNEYVLNESTYSFVQKMKVLKLDLEVIAGYHGKVIRSKKSIDSMLTQATVKASIQWSAVPSGTFVMGSPANEEGRDGDETQHEVSIGAFQMSKYEVTFAQFDQFCETTGRKKPNDMGWGRGNRPVLNVSWSDAVAFAEWIGGRLPTEAEWEYACRAGTSSAFYTGNCLTAAHANFKSESDGCEKKKSANRTLPVGSLSSNAWGLYDMHGNVWEWCSDARRNTPDNVDDYSTSVSRENNNGPFRARRGGAWNFEARFCRSSNRGSDLPEGLDIPVGFRVVR
jgi:formylglycine-generating enzyme